MFRRVVLGLCFVSVLAFAACGGQDSAEPIYITANGPGELLVDVQVPDDGTTIRVEFEIPGDMPGAGNTWNARANWRIAVYTDYPGETVASVDRRVTADASVTEAWAARSAPYAGKIAAARAQGNSGARFRTGPGSFQVGISLTGYTRWSVMIVKAGRFEL